MTPTDRAVLVGRYQLGYPTLVAALDGVGRAELDWRPGPEAWTVREVVHHLEDAELHGAVRLRRLLTEDAPAIVAFDEDVYRRRLDYGGRPIEPALDTIRAAHATTAELLARLTAPDWDRAGTHSEEGSYGVERWLAFHAAHTHDHAAQIRDLRAAHLAWARGTSPAVAPPHESMTARRSA